MSNNAVDLHHHQCVVILFCSSGIIDFILLNSFDNIEASIFPHASFGSYCLFLFLGLQINCKILVLSDKKTQ